MKTIATTIAALLYLIAGLLIFRPAYAFTTDEVFTIVNSDRKTPLKRNPKLDTAAQMKADALVACNCFSHNIGNLTPWYFIKKTGYKYRAAGENLAKNFTDLNAMNNAWLLSATHKKNIMAPYKETGIGINGTIVVQLFGY